MLHARAQVCRFPHRRVVQAKIVAHRANHYCAGVEADPNLDGHSVLTPQIGVVLLHRLQHRQRRVAGARGVVLVGEGSAEQRHDPVAHEACHRTLETVYRIHHDLQDGAQEVVRFLRVPVSDQLRGATYVCKQHSDLLPLILKRGPGGKNALCQMFRGMTVRGRYTQRGWKIAFGDLPRRLATLAAELGGKAVDTPAGRAGALKSGPALVTENRVVGVLGSTAWTFHPRHSA